MLAVVFAGPMSAQAVPLPRPVISEFLVSNAGTFMRRATRPVNRTHTPIGTNC